MRKKKLFSAALAAVLAASAPLAVAVNNALSVTANAADTQTSGDWEYEVNEDGETVAITEYSGTDTVVNIPATLGGKSVTTIIGTTFSDHTSITSISIPDSVTRIELSALEYSTSLETITVGENNANYSSIDGVLFNKDKSELIKYPRGKKDKSYTIPDSVTDIDGFAFYGCTLLKSVTIPESVTNLIYNTFLDCTSLESITVAENNEQYSSIDGVLFRSDNKVLVCYPGGKKDKSYTIPDGVTKMDIDAFEGCTSLTSVTIPDSMTEISQSAFEGCTSLTSVTIPNSVTKIDAAAFEKCTSLESITIPDSVTEIKAFVFDGCTSLKSITIPDGVTKIWAATFERCTSLKSITIPYGVTEIGNSAFEGCTSLTSITIPDGVTKIGHSAFEDCTSLTSVKIPDSVTEIGVGAFFGCTSLEAFTVGKNNAKYTSIDGVLFNNEKTEPLLYPGGKKEYTLPDGLTTISSNIFTKSLITSITIPNSVTAIGSGAFSGCFLLETVNYGGTKAEWEKIEIDKNEYNDYFLDESGNKHFCGLGIAQIICTDGIINEKEPETSEPASSDTSTVTPGGSEKPAEQEKLEVTLKNVDSENGIEGAKLDELLFGESGWTWDQVEKIVFNSDKLFSVQYTGVDGSTKTLGEEAATRAAAGGIWNTEWTLDTSLMSKDKRFVKLIAKDGTADIKATIYFKKGASKPIAGDDQANTGIALAVAPIALAASVVIVASKKKK